MSQAIEKVAFEMIFPMSIVNDHLIYKENYNTRRMTILQFCESLVRPFFLDDHTKIWSRGMSNKSNEVQARES